MAVVSPLWVAMVNGVSGLRPLKIQSFNTL